ncbi:hypothetical protein KCU89_g152, partial [Aureobasidium melanogenum]
MDFESLDRITMQSVMQALSSVRKKCREMWYVLELRNGGIVQHVVSTPRPTKTCSAFGYALLAENSYLSLKSKRQTEDWENHDSSNRT